MNQSNKGKPFFPLIMHHLECIESIECIEELGDVSRTCFENNYMLQVLLYDNAFNMFSITSTKIEKELIKGENPGSDDDLLLKYEFNFIRKYQVSELKNKFLNHDIYNGEYGHLYSEIEKANSFRELYKLSISHE